MISNNKPLTIAAPSVTDDLTRQVLIWLSAYPDLPVEIIKPEPMLAPGEDGMEITVIQNAITRRYIIGGYQGEYQFGIFYRLANPTGMSARLNAMKKLNNLGDYAITTSPNWENLRFIKCEVTDHAKLYAPYENGDEDYQILMKLTYEVI